MRVASLCALRSNVHIALRVCCEEAGYYAKGRDSINIRRITHTHAEGALNVLGTSEFRADLAYKITEPSFRGHIPM